MPRKVLLGANEEQALTEDIADHSVGVSIVVRELHSKDGLAVPQPRDQFALTQPYIILPFLANLTSSEFIISVHLPAALTCPFSKMTNWSACSNVGSR